MDSTYATSVLIDVVTKKKSWSRQTIAEAVKVLQTKLETDICARGDEEQFRRNLRTKRPADYVEPIPEPEVEPEP